MFNSLRSQTYGFWYNFTWDRYVWALNNRAAKLSLSFPIIGYAILFNDYVSNNLEFSNLNTEFQSYFYIPTELKLKMAFLGAMLLATANLLYRIWRPQLMRLGESQKEFNQSVDELFSFGDLERLHHKIRRSGFDPLTLDGKYYDESWDAFARSAVWANSGKGFLEIEPERAERELEAIDFDAAKKKHSSLIRSILRETYFSACRESRGRLLIALLVATVGYGLLIAPSLDLTILIIMSLVR